MDDKLQLLKKLVELDPSDKVIAERYLREAERAGVKTRLLADHGWMTMPDRSRTRSYKWVEEATGREFCRCWPRSYHSAWPSKWEDHRPARGVVLYFQDGVRIHDQGGFETADDIAAEMTNNSRGSRLYRMAEGQIVYTRLKGF